MARARIRDFGSSADGAVAPTVALALTALVAMGGLAFDYARLAGMHSELQNAADQAALAAASQLDGRPGATQRAEEAASNLIANSTLISNDGEGTGVGIATVTFYEDKEKTRLVTRDDASDTDDRLARYVEVTVDGREVFYALTPIVDAVSSGDIDATAFAGLGAATCKVPPVMMCNPLESTDPDFTVANYIGKGVRLVANDGGGGYGPGNFGFLDNDAGNGASTVRRLLGNVSVPGNCSPGTGVTTQPGEMISVLDALNTRFDVYANGLNNACGATGAGCPPSANARKDVVRQGNGCAFTNGNGTGWKVPNVPYLPTSSTPYSDVNPLPANMAPMGYPRDICHALSQTGSCSGGRIGDGVWDRYAYFKSNSTNYATVPSSAEMTAMFGSSTPTRYQVYRYEMTNAATRLQPQGTSGGRTSHGAPICVTPGLVPGGNIVDRRRLSVAVINCTAEGVSGRTSDVAVTRWIDVFLVEPSLPRARTEASDVYVEVIGESGNSGDGTAGQVVQREVPYLVE